MPVQQPDLQRIERLRRSLRATAFFLRSIPGLYLALNLPTVGPVPSREKQKISFPPTSSHKRGHCAIPKAVLRLCPGRETFPPFRYRPPCCWLASVAKSQDEGAASCLCFNVHPVLERVFGSKRRERAVERNYRSCRPTSRRRMATGPLRTILCQGQRPSSGCLHRSLCGSSSTGAETLPGPR